MKYVLSQYDTIIQILYTTRIATLPKLIVIQLEEETTMKEFSFKFQTFL